MLLRRLQYGLQMALSSTNIPAEVKLEQRVKEAGFTEPHSEMIYRSKWAAQERRKTTPVRFGRQGVNHRRRLAY